MAGKIFISYRRADQAWARLLHGLLKAEGIEAWYDAHVGAGEDWRVVTAKALEESQIFVLLFSENAAQSSDIAKELAAATLEKKLIIPVRLQNIAPKGAFLYELASRNWINAYDDTEASLAAVAKGLAHLVRTGVKDESALPFERVASAAGSAPRKGKLIAAAAVTMAVAASVAAAWLFWPAPKWTVEKSRPFIATLELEDFPAFSLNGAMLAYTSGPEGGPRQIYVRTLAGGEGVRLTKDSYDDSSPSWSSDGAHLAYIATRAGEPCHIMVATVPAGETREAGRCAQGDSSTLAWQPNSSTVYFSEHSDLKGDILYRVDLDSGVRQRITSGPALRDTITSVHCSPDGKWLAYLFRGREAILRELSSGRQRSLGLVSQSIAWNSTIAWAEDSASILAAISGSVGGSEINAIPLNGKASYSVYSTATRIGKFAAAGGLLAIETDISRRSLARASTSAIAQPDIIDAAGGLTWSPDFAPDGTLVFLSNRSGTNVIWQMKPGAAPTPLIDGGNAELHRIRLSPDGTMLAVASETPQTSTVKIMNRAGATLSQFNAPSIGIGLPNWTLDGKAVLIFDRHTLQTMRVPIGNAAQQIAFAPPHMVGVSPRKEGVFAIRVDKDGIWRTDGEMKQINSDYPRYYDPPLAFRGGDVLVPQYTADGPVRILAQPLSGGPSRLIAYASGAMNRPGFQSDFAVNPVTGDIIYTALVSQDTNIDLLTLGKH